MALIFLQVTWGSDSGGVWRLPLNAVIMDEEPGYVAYPSTCTTDTFSFSLQTVGGCTNPTLNTTLIADLDSNEYQISRSYHSGGLDTSWIMVNPAQAGTQFFTVTAQYTADSGIVGDTSFTLALHVSPAQNLSINLPPGGLLDTNQGTVSIPIYASSTGPITGVSVTFRINMRTDLLTPESISATIPGAETAPLQVDDSGAWITLTLPSNFSISSDTLIATLVCRAFVTDTNGTAITIGSSSGNSNCLSILGTGGETFTLIPQCGDPTLTQFLLTGSPLTITSIVPNPAQDEITVMLSGSANPEIEMYDALGRTVLTTPQPPPIPLRSIGGGVVMDVSGVPSGIYFIRVSAGGYMQSRSVVVQH